MNKEMIENIKKIIKRHDLLEMLCKEQEKMIKDLEKILN